MAKKFKVISMGRFGGGSSNPEEKEFAKAGLDVEFVIARYNSEDELIAGAKDADAIMGGGRFLTPRAMAALPKLQIIQTYSVGFDTLDVDAATANRILIVNNPAIAWCVEEVSNHALALLLACAKKLTQLNDLVKQGRWADTRRITSPMASIHGQTLGVIGCGNIGRMTARKAQAFGLKVIGYDPYVEKSLADSAGITLTDLNSLLRASDFVTLHTPLNDETRGMINAKIFHEMKPTAYFINTARGRCVDEKALIEALQKKMLAGAGLDVFEMEPVDPANPLLKMDNVIVMPHSASQSDAAVEINPVNPAQEVARVLSGQWPKYPVNPEVKPKVELTRKK